STSMIGFTATAYTNIFWLIGLSLLGNKIYFPANIRYHPMYYITFAIIFIVLHTTHAIIVYQVTTQA
ncbi:MAG TPA: hypothetical protein VLA72_11665, partial [Anaerolineales bacterium]|nr:hypothetical protein [Anaerolineales bacterium]